MNDIRLNTIDEAIEDLRDGKLIIVVDDEDRENEGDFIAAAEKITPEMVNFMVTEGRGLICVPITEERCEELDLGMMVGTKRHSLFLLMQLERTLPRESRRTTGQLPFKGLLILQHYQTNLAGQGTFFLYVPEVAVSFVAPDIQRQLLILPAWQV